MKLAVIGTSTFKDKRFVYEQIKNLQKSGINITLIVSGKAPGPDTFGEQFADEFKIPKKIFEAQWDDMKMPCFKKINSLGKEYNALAGFNRNSLIVQEASVILAFWDGKSHGTKDSITKAEKLGKKVIIVKIK